MTADLPEILLYACFLDKERFDYSEETYDCDVLFLLLGGAFEFYDSCGNVRQVRQGEAVYCPASWRFVRRALESMELHMIKFHFSVSLPSEIKVLILNSRIVEDVKRIAHKRFCAGDNIPPDVKHYCSDAVFEVCRSFISLEKEKDHEVDLLLKYLESQVAGQVKNSQLCRIMNCSEATLISRFRCYTGMTPQKYLTDKRMEVARQFLAQTDMTIGEIAEKCGYEDKLYFSRAFVKHTGMTATAFRKKYQI